MPRLLLIATCLLVVWGALAFGAVYPWAWRPLIAGCAVVGVASWIMSRRYRGRSDDGALLVALASIALAALLQWAPIPRESRLAFSPASEALLMELDLEYANAARLAGGELDTSASAPEALPRRSLSIDPDATSRALVMLAGMTLLLAGLDRLLNVTGARRLVTWLVVFGTGLALFGILQRAVLGDHAWGGMRIYGFWRPGNLMTTPFGPFVNKNHFAGWMLMGIPLAMGLGLGWAERSQKLAGRGWRAVVRWLSSPDGGKAQMAAMATVVMGVSLLLTRSRSGIAVFVVSMLIASLVVGRRFGAGRARWLALGALLLLLVTAFAWAGTDVTSRFATGSFGLRKNIWHDSVSVIRDFPLTGTGLNTFGTAMLKYQTGSRELHFQEAHNDYLQLLVEGGLLLALPIGFAMAMLVRSIRRQFSTSRDDAMAYWLRVGATTGLIAIGLQSLVEFSLQMPGNAVFAVVLMAVALHTPPKRSSRPSSEPPFPVNA